MFENIKAIATDVDGVLTDGTFWWGADGSETKRFHYADISGIAMARNAGIHLALISGESSDSGRALVQRYADRMKIPTVYAGCHDKAAAVTEFAQKHGLQLSQVCFIGDDNLDIPAFKVVGLAVAPANAQNAAREAATFISSRPGGHGVVREVIELILKQQNP
jgi:3-deoxy-D-manno-octulosonate 8-phosphate phosphatase (KDO 8-P phosphatase)